jgi:hypothetical protein
MSRSSFNGLALVAVLCALPASAGAAVVLDVGSGADCGAGGCFVQSPSYSRTWSAGDLDGAGTISAIRLSKSLLGAAHQDSMVTVNFYAADGSLAGTLGSFTPAALGGEQVTLAGSGVAWDPRQGDLTVRITLTQFTSAGAGGGGEAFFGASWAAAPLAEQAFFLSAPDSGPAPLVSPLSAPSLQFAVASPNPEPTTWAMMIMGFGAAGAMLRRRRTAAPA